MQPVPGHPYVLAAHGPDPYCGYRIVCKCLACGDQWVKECKWPGRADAWIAWYCARHVHDHQELFQPWAMRYAQLDQQFKMAQRGY